MNTIAIPCINFFLNY